ncbi:hypothetical protein HHK36_012783 [Tetracentron sinense]|uniref:Uncharacterized protein n=1 Tax=Tetracentron sinense TaxID=13715 RepID=A0A835DII2_TETSI|nr:hypothetical protein HHK36_012783 [Tetracentron sinense]
MVKNPPLHVCRVQQPQASISRIHSLVHSMAILALFYYRVSILFDSTRDKPTLAWALIFASELLLSFIWLLNQAQRWRPVSRTAFPERLPADKELPAIDVFICTADPKREPTVEVMNTVLSAMSLDYPPEKLSVYLSDDGGSSLTLYAMQEALFFARSWLPFCRMYGVKTRCPKVYFSESEDGHSHSQSTEFMADRETIKSKYELFKDRVERARENEGIGYTSVTSDQNPSPLVEVIHVKSNVAMDMDQAEIPLLVYVSRENRPTHPHHFKAGALNVLLRVSGVLSNSPYILVLDCDMNCNDPTSARQAMCFLLDPKISHSLSFVQFPQNFYNISENDIYDCQLRSFIKILWPGYDGHRGPFLSGTGVYIKRKSLYGSPTPKDIDLIQLKQCFGPSNEFIASLCQIHQCNTIGNEDSSNVLQETRLLASCTYEKHTQWGEQARFILHCNGWTSVYCQPSRPAFLGSTTVSMNDIFIQQTRWNCGLLQVGFSRFCPLTYGTLRMSVLQSMCYGFLAFRSLFSIPLLCFATIPQLCLFNGIPIYPKVTDSWFIVFAFVFVSALCKHLSEVLLSGGSFRIWRNEQRIWMLRSVTVYFFGFLDVAMKWIGKRGTGFVPTSKVIDKEHIERYQMGKFDFQAPTMLLVPLIALVVLNMETFIGGVGRVIIETSYDKMFGQIFHTFFILTISYPVIEGMIQRKDRGRVPTSVTLLSVIFSIIFLSLGSVVLI